jgi:hypothetical protein
MSTPPPVPVEDVIDNLWKSVTAGQITWKALGELQTATMPLCAAHEQPSNVRIGNKPLCVECLREGRHRET